jgi:hypothetical protein
MSCSRGSCVGGCGGWGCYCEAPSNTCSCQPRQAYSAAIVSAEVLCPDSHVIIVLKITLIDSLISSVLTLVSTGFRGAKFNSMYLH